MRGTQPIQQHRVSRNVNVLHRELASFGDKLADDIARFAGSWTFIIAFIGVLTIWIGVNMLRLLLTPFDPFPFVLLNLVLSCMAALQAPIILMSLNRHAMHNRLAAETDFDTNVNAETQVENLHRKIDSLRQDQWAELVAYQLQQIELLEQIVARQTRPRARANGVSVDSRVPSRDMASAVQ
ncbi:MAG TPA: DUF1003 domain-containing protein, partial [Chloroflexota bacterium]|nr:DUF1003 domain-containing protein [Chloroflexota bacterium]